MSLDTLPHQAHAECRRIITPRPRRNLHQCNMFKTISCLLKSTIPVEKTKQCQTSDMNN